MKNVTIAVDMNSGDVGLRATLPAVIRAANLYADAKFILVGKEEEIRNKIPENLLDKISIKNATQTVEMADNPVKVLRSKKDSSMRVSVDLVKDAIADICVSSGNTGALMAMSHTVLKTLPGVDRPAILGVFPDFKGNDTYALDLGANVTATSDNLFQFALLAAAVVDKNPTRKPRVALLNIGQEDIKGTPSIKEAAIMIKGCDSVDFIGYIESDKLLFADVDIIVCDGFTGNIMLKSYEGMVKVLFNKIVASIKKRPLTGFILKRYLKNILKESFSEYRTDKKNGAIFIGLNGLVVKSHGNAGEDAFLNSIELAYKTAKNFCLTSYIDKLGDYFEPKVVA